MTLDGSWRPRLGVSVIFEGWEGGVEVEKLGFEEVLDFEEMVDFSETDFVDTDFSEMPDFAEMLVFTEICDFCDFRLAKLDFLEE